MTKNELLQKVQDVIDAPSCYEGLRQTARAYLDAVGKENEHSAAEKLIRELEQDVQSIDNVIPFFASEQAKELFGADQAAAMLAQAKQVKADGGDTCFCPACMAGRTILDHKDELL